jgi:hypothetical protein
MFGGFFFLFAAPLLMVQGGSVRQLYWRIISKMNQFGAPCLLTGNRLIICLYLAETEKH